MEAMYITVDTTAPEYVSTAGTNVSYSMVSNLERLFETPLTAIPTFAINRSSASPRPQIASMRLGRFVAPLRLTGSMPLSSIITGSELLT